MTGGTGDSSDARPRTERNLVNLINFPQYGIHNEPTGLSYVNIDDRVENDLSLSLRAHWPYSHFESSFLKIFMQNVIYFFNISKMFNFYLNVTIFI